MDLPPGRVLRAFRAQEGPRRLAGGRGGSWAVAGLVLKRASGPVHEWWAEAMAHVVLDGLRLAAPVRTRRGEWSCDGWSATRWLEGSGPDHRDGSTWLEVLEAGRLFHDAVATLSRPGCLDGRQDRWALADRAAWGERVLDLHPALAGVGRRLHRALEPLGPSQLVHGDLTGNVLLSETLPPAVIDISPYWRPRDYAAGVVIADALCWHDAPPSLVEQSGVSRHTQIRWNRPSGPSTGRLA